MKPLFIYQAWVEDLEKDVYDGDTVRFRYFTEPDRLAVQRVRIFGVDAPEIRTPDLDEKKRGYAARAYVADTLSACSFVMVTSRGVKSFNRLVGSVLYLPDCHDAMTVLREGKSLAETLIGAQVAKAYTRSGVRLPMQEPPR